MPRRLRVTNEFGDWVVELSGDRVAIPAANVEFRIRAGADGRIHLEDPEGELIGTAARAGGTIWSAVEGDVFASRVQDAAVGATTAGRGHELLASPMPATVVRVAVRPGDRVSAGDTLMVLEAMKMELPIRAPRDATVAAVHCVEGQLVQPDQNLVDLT